MPKLFISYKVSSILVLFFVLIASCKKEAIQFTEESGSFTKLIDMRDIFNLQKGNYWSFDYFIKKGVNGASVFQDTCIFKIEADTRMIADLTFSDINQYMGNSTTPFEEFKFAHTEGFYRLTYLDQSGFRYPILYALADRVPRSLASTLRSPINPALTYQVFNGWELVNVLGKQERSIVWGRDSVASGSTVSQHRIVKDRFYFTDSIGLVQVTKTVFSKEQFGNPDTTFHTFKLRDFHMSFP